MYCLIVRDHNVVAHAVLRSTLSFRHFETLTNFTDLNVSVFLLQIIICGRQVICSYLSEMIEVQLLQHSVGLEGQVQTRKLESSVDPESRLPSFVLEDSEVTGLCVRQQTDQEWSQDVFLKCTHGSNSSILQVCNYYDDGLM